MIEPLASILVNSLLSSRSAVGSAFPIYSITKVMTCEARSVFPRDFFTPVPRRAKGKEKLKEAVAIVGFSTNLREVNLRSAEIRPDSANKVVPCYDKLTRRDTVHHLPRTFRHRVIHKHTPSKHLSSGQKRYASNASDLRAPSEGSSKSSSEIALDKFQSAAGAPDESFDRLGAWGVYTAVVEFDVLHCLGVEQLLDFMDKTLTSVEQLDDSHGQIEVIHKWGSRMSTVLEQLESRITPQSSEDHWYRCLMARVLAISGDLQKAITLVTEMDSAPTEYAEKGDIISAYRSIILSMRLHHDSIHVLDFLVSQWGFLGSYLTRLEWHSSAVKTRGRTLRGIVLEIMQSIPSAAAYLAQRRHWDEELRQVAMTLLIELLCEQRMPEDAHSVLEEARKQNLIIAVNLQLLLVRSLAQEDIFHLANPLYSNLCASSPVTSRFRYFISSGLYLFARQGDIANAEEQFRLLSNNKKWVKAQDIAMLIYTHSVRGDPDKAAALFHQYFPTPASGDANHQAPELIHYSVVIYGFANRCDFDGINHWLQAMNNAGIKPNAYIYTTILEAFARRGDIESISAILEQMRAARVAPNVVTYSTVITLLAHARNPLAAEAIYKRALRERIKPDRRMITSLMNAHVEAGSWRGVIRAFDYIRSRPGCNVRVSIEVYNTLLKAYVFIGAPFPVVSKVFRRLEESLVRPDAYTFALLIQSACDAGMPDVGSDIFAEIDKQDHLWKANAHHKVYIMTILMAGFLRADDKIRAKAIYDQMLERGIQPTSITWGTIISAYANERTDESLQIAEEFLKDLAQSEPRTLQTVELHRTREPALIHLYGPLLKAYSLRQQPEVVESMYQEMLNAGGEPTLGILTTLLDAHRRAGNINGVLQVWPKIIQAGQRYSSMDSLFQDDPEGQSQLTWRRHISILCVPLSIYLDALSAAGMHSEIAAVWRKLQVQGFAFDSHNWNHLAVALVRAGQPERAFEIIERVILPYQRTSRQLQEREDSPDTPLSLNPPPEDETLPESISESPLRISQRRSAAMKIAAAKGGDLLDEDSQPEDFAHPLDILCHISPSWNLWRPHTATLKVLAMVLTRLDSGSIIQPVSSDQDDSQPVEYDIELRRKRIKLAADTLERIYENYPSAVEVVEAYERDSNERQRIRYRMS